MVRLLKSQTHSRKDPPDFRSKRMGKDGSTCGWLGWSDEPVGIDQLDRMIVDPSVLGEFGSQVRREREVGILDGDLRRSLLDYQAVYLRSTGRVNIERGGAGRRNGTDWPDVNYVGLMFRVKLCSCNSFLPTSSTCLVVGRASLVV